MHLSTCRARAYGSDRSLLPTISRHAQPARGKKKAGTAPALEIDGLNQAFKQYCGIALVGNDGRTASVRCTGARRWYENPPSRQTLSGGELDQPTLRSSADILPERPALSW